MEELTLKDIIRAIVNHIFMVVAIPFLAVTVTAYLCWMVLPKTYTATASMYVLNRSSQDTLSSADITVSSQLVNDFSQLAASERVKNSAAEYLGLDDLEDYDISVTSDNSTRFIKVNIEFGDPVMAANVANAISARLAECIIDVMDVENISVIDAAVPPSEPSGPKSLRNCAIAGLLGVMLSVMLAILIESLSTKISRASEVETLLELPVLAQIPEFDTKTPRRMEE